MAKTEVLFTINDPSAELKKELQRLVKSIVDEDDYAIEVTEKAIKLLSALKELKSKRALSLELESFTAPDEFRCPISKELMADPVVLATGQTYDRPFIQKWIKEGHRTCPRTQQVLSHTILTPNHLVREMISQWCKDHGVELPNRVQDFDEQVFTEADKSHLNTLLERMSSSLPNQKEAAKELRLLTKHMPSFRALFGESIDAIPQLLNPLSLGEANKDPDLQEDLITTILNLSIHDSNKKLIAEIPLVIPLLVESLKSGTIETKTNAAAALFTLSALDSNKLIIGKSGALKHLIGLLEEGHSLAMKDVAAAIFNLCIAVENRGRAVGDGAIGVILKKLTDDILVDELLSILAMLSSHQQAIEEMGNLGVVPCLLSLIRDSSCEHNKENCVAILYAISFYDRSKLMEIRDEEDENGTISSIALTGTSRAKRKANGILERLNKVSAVTHTT